MNEKLEKIQKDLNQFLDKTRKEFQRFFFLSNEDLLEIIGNVRDPEPIKKHVKKVFAGIYTIVVPPTNTRAKTF